MKRASRFENVEKTITQDKNLLFTFTSLTMILIIYLNPTFTGSPAIGATASLIFFSINAVFLGKTFFEGEILFIRFTLGILMFLLFLGSIGWVTLIIYNLDLLNLSVALCVLAILCSSINRLKNKVSSRNHQ